MSAPLVYRRRIPETPVAGKPLGRHVVHDPRSLDYLVPATAAPTTVLWQRVVPVFDQGQVGSCTGNAAAGALGTTPFDATLPPNLVDDETEAVQLYSAAEVIDGDGPYPPNDNGSSGLSVAKACKNAGLISGYQHITSIAAAHTAIQAGPFIIGSDWYDSMDTPDANGVVSIGGSVRGGHEYECLGYHADSDLWECVNSWGTSYGILGHFFFTSATFERLLSTDGDATLFTPITAPAPTPNPQPSPPAPAPTPPSPTPPAPTPTRVVSFTPTDAALLDQWASRPHVWHLARQAAEAWKAANG